MAVKQGILEAMSAQEKMVLNPVTVDRLRDPNSVSVGNVYGGLIGQSLASAPKRLEDLRRATGEECPAEFPGVRMVLTAEQSR